jgi:hypothetical protein
MTTITVPAEQLSGVHIGRTITFAWVLAAGINAVVTARILRVSHAASETTLDLAGVGNNTDEYVFDRRAEITLLPSDLPF